VLKTALVLASLLSIAGGGFFVHGQATKPSHVVGAVPVEASVRKLWEAFKNKDKATLSSLLDDGFRQFEEGLSTFGDKKTEVNAVDEYELISYTLSDFTLKPLSPNAVLVTYIAQYEGKSGGENLKAKSVFGEVWTHSGKDWRCSYMQETYVK